jgi:hypothetical protein
LNIPSASTMARRWRGTSARMRGIRSALSQLSPDSIKKTT